MTETGHGSQVVQVTEDHTYELDENELASILLKDDIKDLPVVVVSVAGAFRRGKSFLLNFFLRYLTSPPSARADGSWIGTDDEPLTGFSWRSGTERNTTGILLWSEPFLMALPSGDKVAVILMDTQGTFDDHSTVKDCSTIFGISTLLSSVLIYNLSNHIQENDLQHLELFTEYGRMVQDQQGAKAFQVLEFLVRDWQFPDDYEYGVTGGEPYLKDKILEIKPTMPKEMKELREHINSIFQKVSCFLLPHPGTKVIRKKFSGKISEIDPEFIEYLKELVSSLFGAEKLLPKRVNGELVRARDLYTYFKTYMVLFNSDLIPSTQTIMEATIQAGMLTAVQEAREIYKTKMDAECGPNQPSLPGHDLLDIHKKYLGQARAAFITKKKMGSTFQAKTYLDKLTKELEDQLPLYKQSNLSKTQEAVTRGDEAFKKEISKVTMGHLLCLHPTDLKTVHKQATDAAIKIFDSSRRTIAKKEDIERKIYEESLQQHYNKLYSENEQNNTTIAVQMRMDYWTHMQAKCNIDPPLSEAELKKEHDDALEKAIEGFQSKRNLSTIQYTEDVFKFNLITDINNNFISMKSMNKTKNKAAMLNSFATYNDYMASAWKPSEEFLHPLAFETEHNIGSCRALLAYRPRKECIDGFDKNDPDEQTLLNLINQRYRELKQINDKANEYAVREAYDYYRATMTELCRPIAHCASTEEIPESEKKKHHDNTSTEAMKKFKSRRRPSPFSSDPYEQNLNKMMDDVYKKYLEKK